MSFFPNIEKIKTADDRRKLVLYVGAIVWLSGDVVFVLSNWLVTPDSVPLEIYFSIGCISIVTILLLRFNRITLACYVFVLALNFFVYLIMASEPIGTAFHLHIITAAFMALNLFGYKHRIACILFVLLSFGLGLLGYTHQFSFLEFRNYSLFEVKLYFILNTLLFVFSSTYLLFSMLKWNSFAETVVIKNKAEALQQNDQISKTNAELDRFVFKISHDLRAPLNTLSGLANLASADGEQRAEYFKLMKNQILVMERFIREVADYSKNARLEVERKPIALTKLLEEVIQSMNHLGDFNKVEIQVEVPEDLIIESDALRLKIVLANLITNGIKYYDLTKQKPYVSIKAVATDVVQVFVTDNGIGIDKNHNTRIFDMFYKASDRSKGTGLGLYMVQETLRKLGGEVTFTSVPNQGTTFAISLPIAPK